MATDSLGHRSWIESDIGQSVGAGLPFIVDTAAPGEFEIRGIGGDSRALIWAASPGAESYDVDISEDPKCQASIVSYRNVINQTGILPVMGLQPGRSYFVCMSAKDSTGNTRVAKNTSKSFVYDIEKGRVAGVTSAQVTGFYKLGAVLNLTVRFNKDLVVEQTGTNMPTLKLNNGAVAKYLDRPKASEIRFAYTVESGQDVPMLDYESTLSLNVGGLILRDAVGQGFVSELPTPGAEGSLSAGAKISIDTTAPKVDSITPINGSTGIDVNTEISIVLSSDSWNVEGLVKKVKVVKTADQTSVVQNFTITFEENTRLIKLVPKSGGMTAKTSYTVSISGGADLAGNQMETSQSVFTTK
jgi:hypothetical protein